MKIDSASRNFIRKCSEESIITKIMLDLGVSMQEAFEYWYSTQTYQLFVSDKDYPYSVLRDGPLANVDAVYREKAGVDNRLGVANYIKSFKTRRGV